MARDRSLYERPEASFRYQNFIEIKQEWMCKGSQTKQNNKETLILEIIMTSPYGCYGHILIKDPCYS